MDVVEGKSDRDMEEILKTEVGLEVDYIFDFI